MAVASAIDSTSRLAHTSRIVFKPHQRGRQRERESERERERESERKLERGREREIERHKERIGGREGGKKTEMERDFKREKVQQETGVGMRKTVQAWVSLARIWQVTSLSFR